MKQTTDQAHSSLILLTDRAANAAQRNSSAEMKAEVATHLHAALEVLETLGEPT